MTMSTLLLSWLVVSSAVEAARPGGIAPPPIPPAPTSGPPSHALLPLTGAPPPIPTAHSSGPSQLVPGSGALSSPSYAPPSPTQPIQRQDTLNNIGDWLGAGYDQFLGNPHYQDGTDPGFKAPVFALESYNDSLYSGDGLHLIPDGTDAYSIPSCNHGFFSHEIIQEQNLIDALKMSVEGKFVAVPFSANNLFEEISTWTRKQSNVIIESTSICEKYKARILRYDPPKFTTNFQNGVNSLPKVYNKGTRRRFLEFMDTFGTHVVMQLTMGERTLQRYRLTADEFATSMAERFKLTLAAEIMAAQGSVSLGISRDRSQLSQIKESFAKQLGERIIIGSTPTWKPNGTTHDGRDEPSPLQYTIVKLSEFVGDERQGAMEDALDDYCNYARNPSGVKALCHPLTPIQPPRAVCPRYDMDRNWTSIRPMGFSSSRRSRSSNSTANQSGSICQPDQVMNGAYLMLGGGPNPPIKYVALCSNRYDALTSDGSWLSPAKHELGNDIAERIAYRHEVTARLQPRANSSLLCGRAFHAEKRALNGLLHEDKFLYQDMIHGQHTQSLVADMEKSKQTRTIVVDCPEGHIATGIRFNRYSTTFMKSHIFVNLKCGRSSQPIDQIRFTEFTRLGLLGQRYDEARCPVGQVICGIRLRGIGYRWDKQMYSLRCCQAGQPCEDRFDKIGHVHKRPIMTDDDDDDDSVCGSEEESSSSSGDDTFVSAKRLFEEAVGS